MKYKLTIALFIVCQWLFAQESFKTSLRASDVATFFLQGKETFRWELPISRHEKQALLWQQRITPFTQTENIRTFVGYEQTDFRAVISISNGNIFGNVFTEKGELRIETSNDGFLTLHRDVAPECGLCCQSSENASLTARPMASEESTQTPKTIVKPVPDDNVLRVYRLALPVAYNFFKTQFQSDIQRVKAFWATAQAGLNEIYMRDVGVRFELVNDERLILDTPEKEVFNNVGSNYIISVATNEINKLIGSTSYDMGLFLSQTTATAHGLAYKSFGYFNKNKASATVASTDLRAIAHELGHLFGASHVHEQASNTSGYSHKTETGLGQSVMGYGTPQNFFSLVSLVDMRTELLGIPYYTNTYRNKTAGKKTVAPNYDNFPLGIKTASRAPKLNPSSVKESYKIPPSTFFAFNIGASHPDKNQLLYMAHPADKAINRVSRAKFHTHKPSEHSRIAFEEVYGSSGYLETPFHTAVGNRFTFLIGVSTGKEAHLRPDEVVRYDTRTSQIEIVDAKPFRITSPLKILYNGGEKFTLRWEADPKVFAGTRVRIVLSDDFGKTFNYTLAENTENDGECELVMPHTSFGSVAYKNNTRRVRAGVIKVEVIDHIAYALSVINPLDNTGRFAGGFELDPATEITFTDVPQSRVVLPFESEIPLKHEVKATTQCRNKAIDLIFEEYIDENTSQYSKVVTRQWTAKDKCGKESSFVQLIYVEKQEESFKEEIEDDNQEEDSDSQNNSSDGERGNSDSQNNSSDEERGNSDNQNNSSDGERGNSDSQNNSSDEERGRSDSQNDSSDEERGNSDSQNNSSDEERGNSDSQNNSSDEERGRSDSQNNSSDEERGRSDSQNNSSDGERGNSDSQNSLHDNKNIFDINRPKSENVEWIVYNGVSAEVSSENYLKIEPIDRYTDLHIEIFNELGQKVFQAKDYQRKGDVFRGYANVKGVVGKGKRLPSGTYFYVLKYKNQDKKMHQKSGYLYVR
ncbi:reprolysin-like metallopeptidase [Capnocytophaga stomatis]|uniref:Reprolysin-like metallopeptidase n=1 Tax=Capnocytophaga stomatis TaxID=1848904 RepID=A0ABW8QD13_9FLAO